MENRKQKKDWLNIPDDWEEILEGSFEQVITRIRDLKQNCIDRYGDKYSNYEISTDYYDEGGFKVEVYGIREENDAELANRLASEERIRIQQKKNNILREQKELQEYQRLKLKYECTNNTQ
jgi:hypothetical protein